MLIPHALFAGNGAALGGAPPTSSDSDVQAWISTIGAGNTNQAEVNAITTMVVGMKADGAWALLDRFWYVGVAQQAAAIVDLVARASLTLHSSPIFAAYGGFQGDGSAAYIDTNWSPNQGVSYTQNSASWGVGVLGAESRTGAQYGICGALTNSQCGMKKNSSGTAYGFGVNNGSSAGLYTFSSQTGNYHGDRNASTTTDTLWLNGTQVQSGADGVNTLTAQHFLLLAQNSGSPSNFTNARIGHFYAGGPQIAASMSSRIATCNAALGVT